MWQRRAVPNLILFAGITFLLGISLPMLKVTKLVFFTNEVSLLQGLGTLWKDGSRGLFAIVFLFSVVFPVAKLGLIVRLWFFPLPSSTEVQKQLQWLSALGKWSMMDVFVVALLVVTVKLGVMADAEVCVGAYFFGLSVILTKVVVWLMNQTPQIHASPALGTFQTERTITEAGTTRGEQKQTRGLFTVGNISSVSCALISIFFWFLASPLRYRVEWPKLDELWAFAGILILFALVICFLSAVLALGLNILGIWLGVPQLLRGKVSPGLALNCLVLLAVYVIFSFT